MFKIKKKVTTSKLPILYNIIEDYTEFDEPGNVTVCAMTEKEDLAGHAKVLSESYGVPIETMTHLLPTGGLYVYPQEGGLVTKGLVACRVDPIGAAPKQTWVLDLDLDQGCWRRVFEPSSSITRERTGSEETVERCCSEK